MGNYMHLTFEERCKIEELLNKRLRKYQIAKEVGKTQFLEKLILTSKYTCLQTTALTITIVYILKTLE